MISVSKAKHSREYAGDVRFRIAPRKPCKNTNHRGSANMGFGKVSCESDSCSRGKRPFKVSIPLKVAKPFSLYCSTLWRTAVLLVESVLCSA